MTKYRKRPIEVEAIRVADIHEPERSDLFRFLPAKQMNKGWKIGGAGCIVIRTLEGNMIANVGDWIIRGIAGELYPCKPDIFAATYEKIDP